MADPDFTILKRRMKAYLDVNAFDLTGLRENLQAAANAQFHDTFKSELAQTIAGQGISRTDYENLTGQDFDNDAEFNAYMAGVFAFLFEDGAHP